MVTSEEWNNSKWSNEAGGKKIATFILQDIFWRDVLYALKLGSPLIEVLRMVDGERKPPMGYIYEAMDRAKETIAKSFSAKKDYELTFQIIDKRWDYQLHQPLHAAGYYLNPEFQYDNLSSSCAEVMSDLYACIRRLIPDMEVQDKITDELDLQVVSCFPVHCRQVLICHIVPISVKYSSFLSSSVQALVDLLTAIASPLLNSSINLSLLSSPHHIL